MTDRAFQPTNGDEVLDRGVRLDENKPGTGLGMAIASEIANAYGGGLRLDASEQLGGLRVELSLSRKPSREKRADQPQGLARF